MSYSLMNGGKSLKKILVCIIAFALCGCTFRDSYDVKINQEEQDTEYANVYAEILEFGGIKNKEYQSELNLSISETVEGAISQFDALAQETQETLPAGIKSALKITQDVKRNSEGIISFVTENYIYTGGAHGTVSWYPRTVDTLAENPHDLTLGELFTADDYMDRLNVIIKRKVTDNPLLYSELWAEPIVTEKNKNRFYLTDENIVIYFPPYELSYYAKGFVEFPLSYEELSPILIERLKDHSD